MARKTLNQLLTDENFINLEKALNSNNIFSALRIGHHEIRHSKFLAYLLDPKETHGLGYEFLYNFVLWLSNATGKDINIHLFDLRMAIVIPEWSRKKHGVNESESESESETKSNRLDLLITIPSKNGDKESYCIAIECKIKASQSKGQLARYSKDLNGKGIRPNLSILLSISGEDPEVEFQQADSPEWIGIKYCDVVIRALETTQQKIENTAQEKIKYIIADYKKTLQDLSSENGDEISLYSSYCTPLKEFHDVMTAHKDYLLDEHRNTYKYLFKYFKLEADIQGKAQASFNELIKKYNYIAVYSSRKYFDFYPEAIYPFSRDISALDQKHSYPLLFVIIVEPCKSGNKAIRARCILSLRPLTPDYSDSRELIVRKIREANESKEWYAVTRSIITNTYTTVLGTEWEENITEEKINDCISVFINKSKALADTLKTKSVLKETCLLPSQNESD